VIRSLAVLEFSLRAATPPAMPAAAPGTSGPSWNTSTMCLHMLHHTMSANGWGQAERRLPLADDAGPLPRRPLDLGVGLWR
jgi:hypothetical protein